MVVYDEINIGLADKLAQDFKAEIEVKLNGTARLLAIDPKKTEILEVELAKIREIEPQSVLFITNPQQSTIMTEKIKIHTSEIQLYNSMWANTDDLVKMGSIYVDDMVVVSGENLTTSSESYKHFKEIYKERYGESLCGCIQSI